MTLIDKYTIAAQHSNLYMLDPMLSVMNLKVLERLEQSHADAFENELYRSLCNAFDKIIPDYTDANCTAYTKYSELTTYYDMKDAGLKIESVKVQVNPTPDFKCKLLDGSIVYIENKALLARNPASAIGEMSNRGLDNAIEAVRKIESGQKIVISENYYDPFGESTNERHGSCSHLIEVLNQKLIQNIKQDQYRLGETVLFVDISQFSIPSGIERNMCMTYESQIGLASGVLWHLCFGIEGGLLQNIVQFEGCDYGLSKQRQAGIIAGMPFIAGIVFKNSGAERNYYYGMFDCGKTNTSVHEFIVRACSNVYNDSDNRYAFNKYK